MPKTRTGMQKRKDKNMIKKTKCLVLFYVLFVLTFTAVKAENKYEVEFLKRQVKFYSLEKARQAIDKGSYQKAAVNIISIYSIDPKDSLYLGLSLEGKVGKPLEQFFFEAFQEIVRSDPSLRKMENGKKVVVGEWMHQKAKWSDEFIREISYYKMIQDKLGNNKDAADKFFFSGFHYYYSLDNEESYKFLEKFDRSSVEYKVLDQFAKSASGQPMDINEINKVEIGKLSKAMKEMLVTLKGDYYMTKEDYLKAKECYLEFFELGYSLPVHTESLAMCYLAEGNKQKAKSLYLYLVGLYQKGNISTNGIYNMACILTWEGDKEKSLDYLEEAIKQGFPKGEAIKDDNFKSLREDKHFIELTR